MKNADSNGGDLMGDLKEPPEHIGRQCAIVWESLLIFYDDGSVDNLRGYRIAGGAICVERRIQWDERKYVAIFVDF